MLRNRPEWQMTDVQLCKAEKQQPPIYFPLSFLLCCFLYVTLPWCEGTVCCHNFYINLSQTSQKINDYLDLKVQFTWKCVGSLYLHRTYCSLLSILKFFVFLWVSQPWLDCFAIFAQFCWILLSFFFLSSEHSSIFPSFA